MQSDYSMASKRQPVTILDFLSAAATTNAGIIIYPPNGAPAESTRTAYRDFQARARRNSRLVHGIPGISPSSIVLLHFDQHSDHLDWFWAVTVAGYLPAISTPLVRNPSQRKKHLEHLYSVLDDPIVLTTEALYPEFSDVGRLRIRTVESLYKASGHLHGSKTHTPDSIDSENTSNSNVSRPRSDLAVLMLTSGSSGQAKVVCLSHDQIIHAVKGKSQHLSLTQNDTILNWIAMDHVANLVEMHFHAMYLGAEQVHVQALDLLLDPLTFLLLIDKHRVSYAFAPNFFLALLNRGLKEADRMTTLDIDLSCLRVLMCGGEANVVKNLAALTDELHRFGARDEFLRPGFGMTETCAAVTYGQDCPSYDLKRGLEFSSVGSCIPGITMRIIQEDGEAAETGKVGQLQMLGPVVFSEYYNNPTGTQDSFTDDGWFQTGDNAYIDDHGNLNLTGRSKETIVINGVQRFPHEMETAIEESPGICVVPSYTVVFPYRPPQSQTEAVCVVYVPKHDCDDAKTRTETTKTVTRVILQMIGVKPHEIIPLTKDLLPKSSLGKISRVKVQAAFEAGYITN